MLYSAWSANRILGPPDVWPNLSLITTGHLYQDSLKTSLRYGHDYNTCIITILKVEFPDIIKITKIEVYVAVGVQYITEISVLDRIQSSFVKLQK